MLMYFEELRHGTILSNTCWRKIFEEFLEKYSQDEEFGSYDYQIMQQYEGFLHAIHHLFVKHEKFKFSVMPQTRVLAFRCMKVMSRNESLFSQDKDRSFVINLARDLKFWAFLTQIPEGKNTPLFFIQKPEEIKPSKEAEVQITAQVIFESQAILVNLFGCFPESLFPIFDLASIRALFHQISFNHINFRKEIQNYLFHSQIFSTNILTLMLPYYADHKSGENSLFPITTSSAKTSIVSPILLEILHEYLGPFMKNSEGQFKTRWEKLLRKHASSITTIGKLTNQTFPKEKNQISKFQVQWLQNFSTNLFFLINFLVKSVNLLEFCDPDRKSDFGKQQKEIYEAFLLVINSFCQSLSSNCLLIPEIEHVQIQDLKSSQLEIEWRKKLDIWRKDKSLNDPLFLEYLGVVPQVEGDLFYKDSNLNLLQFCVRSENLTKLFISQILTTGIPKHGIKRNIKTFFEDLPIQNMVFLNGYLQHQLTEIKDASEKLKNLHCFMQFLHDLRFISPARFDNIFGLLMSLLQPSLAFGTKSMLSPKSSGSSSLSTSFPNANHAKILNAKYLETCLCTFLCKYKELWLSLFFDWLNLKNLPDFEDENEIVFRSQMIKIFLKFVFERLNSSSNLNEKTSLPHICVQWMKPRMESFVYGKPDDYGNFVCKNQKLEGMIMRVERKIAEDEEKQLMQQIKETNSEKQLIEEANSEKEKMVSENNSKHNVKNLMIQVPSAAQNTSISQQEQQQPKESCILQ